MIMRKIIYVVMRTTDFGRMSVIAFNSAKEAEELGNRSTIRIKTIIGMFIVSI